MFFSMHNCRPPRILGLLLHVVRPIGRINILTVSDATVCSSRWLIYSAVWRNSRSHYPMVKRLLPNKEQFGSMTSHLMVGTFKESLGNELYVLFADNYSKL